MSSDVLVRVDRVGKVFPAFGKPYERLLHLFLPRARAGEFQALRDISFEVRRGEAVGIIGSNGSGKSTLLQIIAGILQPSSGEVMVRARVAALLELGAGFNPEFTGRENIRLNAALLGLSSGQIEARMGQIVAFAEIGEHIDQLVKTYSSGMFVRLAFAVAVHTDPDVLIVDEALAVGDIYFQRKCHRRIEEMRDRGCTLLFVTHSVDLLLQLCDRGIVLEEGRLVFDGEARPAIAEYLKRIFGDNESRVTVAEPADGPRGTAGEDDEWSRFLGGGGRDQFNLRGGYNRDETRLGNGSAMTCDFLIASDGRYGPVVHAREPFSIFARYTFLASLERLVFGIRVRTVDGYVAYSCNTFIADGRMHSFAAGDVAVVEFKLRCSLLQGQYFVTVGVSKFDDASASEIHPLDRRVDAILLNVLGTSHDMEGIVDLEASITVQDVANCAAAGSAA